MRAWPDNTTDSGWGLQGKDDKPGFMVNYARQKFNRTLIEAGYDKGLWNFAFVMRSMAAVCIDIDGKNGGFQHALKLGALPYTLAERSKSGNGYHLFYATPLDVWDDEKGFALYGDRIGIQQGVDIRGTGCVFHHPQQRWNARQMAVLPKHLADMLDQRKQAAAAQVDAIIKVLNAGDTDEILILQEGLVTDLKKPIPEGRRNGTLFAIGSQMCLAKVPNWRTLIRDRAGEVGLDVPETCKLLANIEKYTKGKP